MEEPILRYSSKSGRFGLMNAEGVAQKAYRAGWKWDEVGFFSTTCPYRALGYYEYADESARVRLEKLWRNIEASSATRSDLYVPAPEGLEYMPFQVAGIDYAARRSRCLLAEEPGLGKTVEALGVANIQVARKLLVICPASLRLNWAREIEKWHLWNQGIEVVLNGKAPVSGKVSLVTSYELTKRIPDEAEFDLVIVDEAHFVKNQGADRTRRVLGTRTTPGLIKRAPRLLVLTGTPIPNRVSELYPLVRAVAPAAIDSMTEASFLNRFAAWADIDGRSMMVGVKNERELYWRLRANVMVRRLKSEVLQDLPPKMYSMTIFSADGFKEILEQENKFSAQQIIDHGIPVGSPLPEIRHQMAVAKAPMVVDYISTLLNTGVKQVIVFAHHKRVVEILEEGLEKYGCVTVTGATPPAQRQAAVDSFQAGEARVFLGNIVAAGTGITLTAAADIVFAEASWVPGENEQAEDRAHRIGQERGVRIHYTVVEGSLDAKILGSAARKRENIVKILDHSRGARQ